MFIMERKEEKPVFLTIMNNNELQIIGVLSIDPHKVQNNTRTDRSKAKITLDTLMEFCAETTVHGVRYIAEQRRHWFERIWWLIAFCLSVGLCAYAIMNIWNGWQERPVIVTFGDRTTSVGKIPFPAITICSSQKFSTEQLDLDHLKNMIFYGFSANISHDEANKLNALQQICFKWIANVQPTSINESVYKIIKEISPTNYIDAILHQLIILNPIFTTEGLCYTFNSLNSHEIFADDISPELLTVSNNPNAVLWSMESGYNENDASVSVYPHRVFSAGVRDTLVMYAKIVMDNHRYCQDSSQGFRVSLHSPDELPQIADDFIRIPTDQEVFISVKPQLITTSNSLRSFSPEKRGCYFKSERKLRFFKQYSRVNCEMECVANFTEKECGCLMFWMSCDRLTKVCTMTEYECYYSSSIDYSQKLVLDNCNCLPDCTSISYDVEVSQAPPHYSPMENDVKGDFPDNDNTMRFDSNLYIKFKQTHFIALTRTNTYTMTDFIASVGGLLGLFMGISLLSIFELIYYITLRLFCTLKRNKTNDENAVWAKRSTFHYSYSN